MLFIAIAGCTAAEAADFIKSSDEVVLVTQQHIVTDDSMYHIVRRPSDLVDITIDQLLIAGQVPEQELTFLLRSLQNSCVPLRYQVQYMGVS